MIDDTRNAITLPAKFNSHGVCPKLDMIRACILLFKFTLSPEVPLF